MSTLQTQYQNFLKDFPTSNLTYYEWMDIKFSKIPEEINKLKNNKIKNMENLYNYVLWYNSYNETWYGIPTEKYLEFKSGDYNVEGLKTSIGTVNDLIELIID